MSIIVEFAKLNVQININEHKTNEPGETSPINIYAETEYDYYRYFSLPVPTPFSTFKKFMAFNERNPPMIIYDNEKIIVQYICEIFDVDIRLELSKDTIDDITIEKRKYLILEDKYKELNTKYEDLNKEIDAIKKYLIEAKSENKTYRVFIDNQFNFIFENKEHELILLNYCKQHKHTVFVSVSDKKVQDEIDNMQSFRDLTHFLRKIWNGRLNVYQIIAILFGCNFIIQDADMHMYGELIVNSIYITYIIPKNNIYKNYYTIAEQSFVEWVYKYSISPQLSPEYSKLLNKFKKSYNLTYAKLKKFERNTLSSKYYTIIIYECE